MTQEAFRDDLDEDRLGRPAMASSCVLPLVSVVVVNYNYGRFLEEAVGSVYGQTYPRVECIVVDNASTDETSDVLDRLTRRHAALRVIRRAANDGQTPASLDGLAAAQGAYVVFLDADDFLLPAGIETHVYAHLSLRTHVGFTSGDMLQVADGQLVVAGGEDFNAYIRRGKGLRPDLVRPFRSAGDMAWPGDDIAEWLDGTIHIVPPFSTKWVWSPTSGSCYRRDALALFADNPSLASLRTGTDMYFGHAIGALCGSALIDAPVFAYRIHGDNIFTRRAQLDRTLTFKPGSAGDSNAKARFFIIDHLVAHAARFAPNIWLKLNLVWLLLRLDQPDPDPGLAGWQRRSRLAQVLARQGDELREVLGPWLTGVLRIASRVPYPRF